MSTLAPNDYDLLLECIRELHSFRSQSTLRSWLLDTALPKLIPSDWLSYNEVDLLQPENTVAILKPESSEFSKLFPRFREVAYQHPLIVRQMQSVDFPVHKISDFLTHDAYHKLDLYQDVYKVMGVEFQIAATIRLDPGHVTAFALSRQKNDYTERDRDILEMLRPHLVVAFNNLALINAHQAMLDTTKLALHELASATIIIDPQDQILYHTGAGLQWIGATSPGILPAKISDWLKETPARGNHETLRLISNATEIFVRIVPTDSAERRLLILTQKNPTLPTSASSKGFGLSKRQLEVAQWIGEGKTNAEIAAILGISPRTVQKHVEHIFEKMSVETRVAIATRLLD
ncbi:MAG: helix-turn-helix transcriptional regulator [Limisphaerales bacterium]